MSWIKLALFIVFVGIMDAKDEKVSKLAIKNEIFPGIGQKTREVLTKSQGLLY